MHPVWILGCRVDAVGRSVAVARIDELAHGKAASLVVTLGTEMVMCAQTNAAFRAVVNESALSLCDTIGLLLASRLQNRALGERITGVELVGELAARSARSDLRLYLLGGRDDVANVAAERLRAAYAGAQIVGARNGYFQESESREVATAIASSGANVLLAALGSPKQELWLHRYLADTGCRVGIGVVGSLDVIAGTAQRASPFWQRLGLEWLYRLIREPRRWRRQIALPQFAAAVIWERLTVVFGYRAHREHS